MGKKDAKLLKQVINKGDALYLFFENTTQFLSEVYGADSQKVLKYLNDNDWFSETIPTLDEDDFKDKNERRYLIFYYSSYYYYKYSKNINLNDIYKPTIKWWENDNFVDLFTNLKWYEKKREEDQFVIRKNESLYSKIGVKFNILPDKVKEKAIFNKSYVFDDDFFKPCFENTGDINKNLFISTCLLFYRPTYDKRYKFTDILSLYFNKHIKSKLIKENINYYFQVMFKYNSFEYLEFIVGIDFKSFIGKTFSFGDTSKKLYIHLDDDNILYYVNDENLLKLNTVNDEFLFLKNEYFNDLKVLENLVENLERDNYYIKQNNNDYELDIQSLKTEKSTLKNQIKKKDKEIYDLDKEYTNLVKRFDGAVDYYKRELKIKDGEYKELLKDLDLEKQNKEKSDFAKIRLQNKNTKLEKAKANIIKNLRKLSDEKKSIKGRLDKLEKEREDLLKKADLKKKTIEDNKKFTRENLELKKEKVKLKRENVKLIKDYTELVKRKEKQDIYIRGIEVKLENNEFTIKDLSERLENLNIRYDELYYSSEECKLQLEDCKQEKENLENIIELQAQRIRDSEKDAMEAKEKVEEYEKLIKNNEQSAQKLRKKLDNAGTELGKVRFETAEYIKEIESEYINYTVRTEKNLKNLRTQFRIKQEELDLLKDSQNNLRNTLTLANEKIRRLEWLNEKAIDAQQNYIKKTFKNPKDTKLILDTVKNVSEKTGLPESTMLANIKLSTTNFVKRNRKKLVLGAFGLVMLAKMTGGDKNLINDNIVNNTTFQNFTSVEAPTILDYNNTDLSKFEPDNSALVLSDLKIDEDINQSVLNFPLGLNKLPATTEEKVIDITIRLDGSIDIPNNYDLYINNKALDYNLELDREVSVLNKSEQTEYLVNYFIENNIFFVEQEFFNETKDSLGLVQLNGSTDVSKLNESQLRYLVNTAIDFLKSQKTQITVGAIYGVTLSLSYYILALSGMGNKNRKLPRLSAKNYTIL